MTRIAAIASLTSATSAGGGFYYPLTNTSSDPTYTTWRGTLEYTFVPNDGIYTSNPITNMQYMFRDNATFNDPDISSWDVSSVISMFGMFQNATTFNQDISSWVVSSVISMNSMFQIADAFNQDISSWDVSSVTDMSYMFRGTDAFNNGGVALNWGNKTVLVQNMSNMFRESSLFNQDISGWNLNSVTNMATMFYKSTAFNNGGVALTWGNRTANVQVMANMFRESSSFNQDISSWNVSSVTNMGSMFRLANAFNQDISGWNVNSVTNAAAFSIGAAQKGTLAANWQSSEHPSNAGLGNFYNL